MKLLPMTPIYLPLGNYPSVTALVSEHAAVLETTGERTALRFETVDTEDAFVRLGDQWNDLVQTSARPSPFMLHCWLLEWWRFYGEGCRLAVETAYRGERLVGALPLVTFSRRGLRVATFIGARQSCLGDVLLAEGEGSTLVEALVGRVRASEHDYADLFGLSADSRLAALQGSGSLRLFERVAAPVLDIREGWPATYRAKTDSRKRSHHKRRRRQLAELGKVEVGHARTIDELAPALEEGFRIHELRWRGRPDGSGLVTETGMRFNRAALRGLAELDASRIVSLLVDGRTIAFSWYFVLGDCGYLHRLAFDPAFARCSPGLINALDTLESVADDGVTRVEFLGGAERYKLELADRVEPLHLGLGLPGSTAGRAVVRSRATWLGLRERGKRSEIARKLYDGSAGARHRLRRRRDVLRPTGIRRAGD
jgi:CelD/BcsL family acetyltransferase involved in cellulose biosynthesis